MEISQIIPHVEALIFAADRPLPLLEIVDLLNNALAFLEDRTNLDQVEAAMEAIREKYSSEFYAFEVRSSGGGYQFLTKKEYYQTVAQLNGDKFLKRLSTAALETLAIIAYRQPISKGEIEYIRGVSTDYSIQKLLEKELIVITGRSEDQPGKPLLYAVSRSFMDYFGLASVADLPKLKELFDEEIVQPTLISDETATLGRGEHSQHNTEGIHSLVVSEDGELLDPDHQLDHITAAPPEEETPASEDEEVEPDDEIVHLDDFIEEANEELENNDEETGSAEIIDIPAPEPEAAPDEEIAEGKSNEDPDGMMEDAISHMPDTTENIPAQEEANKTEETNETPKEDDGLEEFDNSFEERLFGEKLLQVNGPDAGNEEEEDEEDEEDDDDEDDWDDEDDEDDEEDDSDDEDEEEDDDESTDPGDRRK
ncbi:segregation and condensation protein B [Chitinophaga polysaccharea]|uniref:Segregation and condensation protein B n=1 Tax=Chitinophaga polysaccharea TaxID=1293035 RepID=A0A561Q4S0_9BACT|nr:SMC-Scp complex subunit ScpB [Chitinophaga polysaccharea]TWF45361.1 segregation and condensation protein B [Chitinophaga polysaccharea]